MYVCALLRWWWDFCSSSKVIPKLDDQNYVSMAASYDANYGVALYVACANCACADLTNIVNSWITDVMHVKIMVPHTIGDGVG